MPPVRHVFAWTWLIDRYGGSVGLKELLALATFLGGATYATCGVVMGIVTYIFSTSPVSFFESHPGVSYYFLSSLVTALVVILVSRRLSSNREKSLIQIDTLKEYRILQTSICAHIISEHQVNYYYRYWIKGRQDNTCNFETNFTWTSDERTMAVELINPAGTCRVARGSHGWRGRLIIDLVTPISRRHKEQVDFVIKTNSLGAKPPDPTVGLFITSPKFPRFNTFLSVLVEEGVDIRGLRRETHFGNLDEASDQTAVNLDNKQRHIWPVPCALGWKYRLKWHAGV